MKLTILLLIAALGSISGAVAEEKLPTLQVGEDTFTNVTILEVTATDIYFQHSRGVGNMSALDIAMPVGTSTRL